VASARLDQLPSLPTAAPGLDLRIAVGARDRLLGLAGLAGIPANAALLLPRTRSVHTLGMRFALDLAWLDPDGRVVRVDTHVRPGRLCYCRRARAVIEMSAGGAERLGLRPAG